MDQPQALCFVLPVWNESYVDLFLNYALPSQLAYGNLNALNKKNVYCIYTREQDKQRIQSHHMYEKLADLITVRFEIVDEIITDYRLRAGSCYGHGIAYANSMNAAIVLTMPDVLYSAGSFRFMQQQLQQGYKAIMAGCHTVEKIKGTVLLQKFIDARGVITLSGRDCIDIVMQAMHNNTKAKFYVEEFGNLMPGCLSWYVGKQGILTHAFHLPPIVALPNKLQHRFIGTIDREFLEEARIDPAEILIVQDSDDFCLFEIAAESHIVDSTYRKGNPDDIIDWAIIHANSQHRAMFHTPIRLKSNQYFDNDAQWLQVEEQANVVVEYVQHILTQKSFSLIHYMRFRYAYLRKFILTLHSLEWQNKHYKWRFFGKLIVTAHNNYLVFAARCTVFQTCMRHKLAAGVYYWPRKLGNHKMPLTKVLLHLEQWTLKNNSPILIQMLLFPITYPMMWLGILGFNLLIGGLRIARD